MVPDITERIPCLAVVLIIKNRSEKQRVKDPTSIPINL